MSLDLDVRSRLMVDAQARAEVQKLVAYLDEATELTADSGHPHVLAVRLQVAVGQLTAEGIEVIGAYIRDEPDVSERGLMFEALEKAHSDYEDWQTRLEAEAIRRNEEAEEEADALAANVVTSER